MNTIKYLPSSIDGLNSLGLLIGGFLYPRKSVKYPKEILSGLRTNALGILKEVHRALQQNPQETFSILEVSSKSETPLEVSVANQTWYVWLDVVKTTKEFYHVHLRAYSGKRPDIKTGTALITFM